MSTLGGNFTFPNGIPDGYAVGLNWEAYLEIRIHPLDRGNDKWAKKNS